MPIEWCHTYITRPLPGPSDCVLGRVGWNLRDTVKRFTTYLKKGTSFFQTHGDQVIYKGHPLWLHYYPIPLYMTTVIKVPLVKMEVGLEEKEGENNYKGLQVLRVGKGCERHEVSTDE